MNIELLTSPLMLLLGISLDVARPHICIYTYIYIYRFICTCKIHKYAYNLRFRLTPFGNYGHLNGSKIRSMNTADKRSLRDSRDEPVISVWRTLHENFIRKSSPASYLSPAKACLIRPFFQGIIQADVLGCRACTKKALGSRK